MPARTREHLHQLGGRVEKARKTICTLLDDEALAQSFFLRRDTDRTIVGFTGSHAQTTDRLQRAIADRDSVGTEREHFDEVRFRAKSAGGNQRDIPNAERIKVSTCARDCGHRRN